MVCRPIFLVCALFLLRFLPNTSASEEDDDGNEIFYPGKYLVKDYSSIGARKMYRRMKEPSYRDVIPIKEERVHYFDIPSINFRRSLISYPPNYVNALVRKSLESNTRSMKNPPISSLRPRKPSFVHGRQKSAIEQANDSERQRTLVMRDYIQSMNKVLRENAIRLQNQIFLRDAMVKAMMHPPSGLYRKILQNPIQTEEQTLRSAFAYMLGNKQNPYMQRYERMKLERLLRHNQEGIPQEARNQPMTTSRRFVAPSYAKLQQSRLNYPSLQQSRQRAFYLARNRALKAQQKEIMKQKTKATLKSALVPYNLPIAVNKVKSVPIGSRLMPKSSAKTTTITANNLLPSQMNEVSKTPSRYKLQGNKGSSVNKAVLISRINTANLISSTLNGLHTKLLYIDRKKHKGSLQQGTTTGEPHSEPVQNAAKLNSKANTQTTGMVPIPEEIKSKYNIKIDAVPLSRSLTSLDKIKGELRHPSDLEPLKVPTGSGDIRVELQKSQSGLFNCTKNPGAERGNISVDVQRMSDTVFSQANCSGSSEVSTKRTNLKPGANDDKVQKTAVSDSSKSPHILFSNLPNIGNVKPIKNTTLPKEMLKAASKHFEKEGKTKSLGKEEASVVKENTEEKNKTRIQQNSGTKFSPKLVHKNQDHRTKEKLSVKQQRKLMFEREGEREQNRSTLTSGFPKDPFNKDFREQTNMTKTFETSEKRKVQASKAIVDEEVPAAKFNKQFVSNSEIDDSGDPMADALSPRASALLYKKTSRTKKILSKRARISAPPTFELINDEEKSGKNDLDRSISGKKEISEHQVSDQEMISGSGMPSEERETIQNQLLLSKDNDSSNELDHRHHVKWHFFRHRHHKNYGKI